MARFNPGADTAPIVEQPVTTTPTGLAAWPDSDLLVATAAGGTVTGLSLAKLTTRWSTQLPGGGPVATPQFDEAGRIVVTTTGGAVAVLDPDDGSLMGLYREPNPIVTAPALDTGTAYYGCADPAAAAAQCDGALHSLVLGGVVALRLGLDADGAVQANRAGYAVIEVDQAAATLHLLDVQNSCIEAWINVPPAAPGAAGGVLGICPTSATDAFDLNLSVKPDGTVQYAARGIAGGNWSGLSATVTCAELCNGRWHHLAVSRTGARVVVYVDGQPQAGVATEATTTAPQARAAGLTAYVGAVAADDLSPAQPWAGMIAEVRVWDSYLTATEISTRMHVKLRGDEPDLISYWNFDHRAVHDGARQGHDGQLAGTSGLPAWWLVDLPFTLPSYPEIVTSASIAAQDATSTTYDLQVTVLRADGSPLPEQPIELWYVVHDSSEPASIQVGSQQLTGVSSALETDATKLTVTSGPLGTAKLTVTTSLTGHGPSLDCRAPFMPANERFHVNCLLDNQNLAKPVPPTLTAQTKLIQDYDYSPGGKIDDTRDRTSHRVVLTAENAQHGRLAGVDVALWAAGDAELEIGGTVYPVNAQNTATATTNATGEIIINIRATDLNAPTLYARASFMARNDSTLISPADDAHTQLAQLQPQTLTTPTLVVWSTGADEDPTKKKPLLGSDLAPHAADIASAVRTVMTMVKQPSPAPETATSATRTVRSAAAVAVAAAPPSFDDLRQPPALPRADQATVLRTLAEVSRRPPIDADGLRKALGPNVGFEITLGGTAAPFSYRLLATPPAAPPAAPGTPLGGVRALFSLGDIGSDIFGGIKDGGTDIYDGATSVVVTVADTVQVAITTLQEGVESVVNTVVSSIDDAVNLVVAFFKQLQLAIELIILFLRALFDWEGIKAATRLVNRMLHSAAEIFADEVETVISMIQSAFSQFNSLTGAGPGMSAGAPAESVSDLIAVGGGVSSALSFASSPQALSLFHKLQDFAGGSSLAAGSLVADTVMDGVEDFTTGVIDVLGDLISLKFADAAEAMVNLLKTLSQDTASAVEEVLTTALRTLATDIVATLDVLDTPIDFPYIGPLFEWITGEPLTILNCLCFVVGLAVHVVYFVVTDGTRFSDDGAQWLTAASGGAPAPRLAVAWLPSGRPPPWPPRRPRKTPRPSVQPRKTRGARRSPTPCSRRSTCSSSSAPT